MGSARRQNMYQMNASTHGEAQVFLGYDVGGTRIRAALVHLDGTVVNPFLDELRERDTLHHFLKMFSTLSYVAQKSGKIISAIGVGVAGVVDYKKQQIVASSALRDLKGHHIWDEIQRMAGLPMYICNDAHAAGYAEWRCGASQGTRSSVALFIGTGIGGAIVVEGKLYTGVDGVAGGFGHLALDPAGPCCSCGGRGCLEQLASGPALVRCVQREIAAGKETLLQTVAEKQLSLTGEDVATAALQGDPVALAAFGGAGEWLGIALVNLANTLNVEQFILGGGVIAGASQFIFPALYRVKDRCLMPLQKNRLRVVQGRLGRQAGVIGSALLASTMR
jgi:glucokinase